MAQQLPSFRDLMAAFQSGLFQNRSNTNMIEIVISLMRRIRSMYINNAPMELQERLLASLLDPNLELAGYPERPDPDHVYADTAAGEVQRRRALEISALADCFARITGAMKHTIHQFVPVDMQDRLEIDGTLDRQTVHGILALLTARYTVDVALNQRTYLQQLQAHYNPRTHTIDAYLSFVHHTRSTLALLGQPITDALFVEMICAAVMAGDPNYAAAVDSYLTSSPDRSLNRLERVLTNRSATLALSAANTAIAAAPATANALLPVPSGSDGNPTKSRESHRSGNGNGNGSKKSARDNGDRRSASGRARERPNTKDIGKLARQLQQHLHIQATQHPYDDRRGPRPPPSRGPAHQAYHASSPGFPDSFVPPPPYYPGPPYPGFPGGPYWHPDDV